MMIAFFTIGILIFLMGLVLLVAPGLLEKIDKFLNKRILDGEAALGYRKLLAIFFIVGGSVMAIVGWVYHYFVW